MNSSVLGHEWAIGLLQHQLASGQARHAYLFTGPQGVGKRTLALKFAQAINCTKSPEPGIACGKCLMCLHIEKMQQLDLSIVQADVKGAMIKVDQIRELQHKLSLSPYEARFRVALLLNFEAANANAQNALLKTLEEAPDKVILLITASSEEELLPTIVSRCEQIRLRPLPVPQLVKVLKEQYQIPEPQASQVAHLAGGRTGAALKMLEDPGEKDQHQEQVEMLFELLGCNLRQRFRKADSMTRASDQAQARTHLRGYIETWISVWRDALHLASGSETPLTNLAQQQEIKSLAENKPSAEILTHLRMLEESLVMLDQNVNPRLLLENILLD
jgi:DNA polymerase-3 subunit delta'